MLHLQHPEPEWKTFIFAPLHIPFVLNREKNIYKFYSVFPSSSAVAPVPQMLAGWLALTGCSSDFEKYQAPPSLLFSIALETVPSLSQNGRYMKAGVPSPGPKMTLHGSPIS